MIARNHAMLALLIACVTVGWADPTPPIMPKITETPLPAPVELPALDMLPADAPTQPLTATEAAQIALQRQPSITVAAQGVTASQGRLQQARAGLYPSLTLNGGYTDQVLANATGAGSGGASDGFNVGANVRQLLFDYQRTRDQVRQAGAQEQSARANLSRAQADLVLQVKQAYYTYVQQRRLVDVQEANLRNRQEHLAQARARVQAGVGLPIDVVRAETSVADAMLNLNQAQNAAAVAHVTLAQLMGLDPRTPLALAEDAEPAVATEDYTALQARALAQRPEIKQAQANLQAARYGINTAKTANAPSLVGTVGSGLRGNSFPPSNETLTLGVAVQWNAFDAGNTRGRVMEAQAQHEAAQAQLTATAQAVMADVAQAYLNVRMAELRLVTADAQVANAQEAVRLAQGRYTAGLGTFLDVLDAQASLVTAQTNRVNTQSAINQARAALAYAIYNDPALTATRPPAPEGETMRD